MKKLFNQLKNKFIDFYIIKGILILVSLSGIGTVSIVVFLNKLFHYQIFLTFGEFVGIVIGLICLNLIGYYTWKKLKSRQYLSNGTVVILKTGILPTMTVSEYDFLKNKVLCTWTDENEIKEHWFKQEALKEYVYKHPTIGPSKSKHSY